MGEEVVASSGEEKMMETEKDRSSSSISYSSSEVLVVPSLVLRILLVEADDSTRQIIAALLRKCSYKVCAVADGLRAWEKLKDRPNNVDLILTEVELPSISGFALLTLVMEHEICKNIPVIMMSSQDSISMVLKCMLKGAADFLIKPVRRNEMKNLWQHVWRRQMLNAGQVPENLPDGQHKADAISETNASSNHSSDYVTSMQKIKDCREKGNDSQSSCTSPYLEAECAYVQNVQGLSQMKCKSPPNLSNTDIEKHEEYVTLDRESLMPESDAGVKSYGLRSEVAPCNEGYDLNAVRLEEDSFHIKQMIRDEGVEPERDRGNANIHCGTCGLNDEPVEPCNGAIDLIGTFDSHIKTFNRHSIYSKGVNKFEFAPQLELSLRRFCPSSLKDQENEERHTLNHSNASAFSWYNNGLTMQPQSPALAGNCSKLKESKSRKLLSSQHSENTFGASHPNFAITSNSQKNVTSLTIGQSGQAELAKPSPRHGLISVPGLRFDNVSAEYGPIPLYHSQSGLPSAWSPKFSYQQENSPLTMSTSIHSNAEIYGSGKGYNKSDETLNHSGDLNMDEQNNMEPMGDLRQDSPVVGQSEGSSLCNGVANHNSSSLYGGISSGSENVATSVAVVEKALAPQNFKDGGIFAHDKFRGMDSYHSSQREAALTKFRLKRKDRCYEKKVRYQSRKRLAEQRPRVKGQFVRQLQTDTVVSIDADGCH
ncbi:Response_reg domain-containing protein/CCT domain-containing protein [Cephalotus follicularis]|uniref:Response_reg domain-containing protein/CCT domain-containing protein n=1 Tax=Cephalotus follicularis TaxID=3775 RepID=A0A1Q3C3D9_CEPFO|nr:Response_reg domain-containing protein/CCT domain-containing protein [Cephalotus follicularis]